MRIFELVHSECLVKQVSPLEPSPKMIFLTISGVRSVDKFTGNIFINVYTHILITALNTIHEKYEN